MSDSTKKWFAAALVATVLTIGVTFLAGFLLGHFTGGTSTTTVEESGSAEGESATEAEASEPGAQVFTDFSCGNCHTFDAAGSTGTTGPNLNEYLAPDDNSAAVEEMIVDPEAEIAEGYPAGVMPQDYGQTIPKEELEQLVQFLVANSPAGGTGE